MPRRHYLPALGFAALGALAGGVSAAHLWFARFDTFSVLATGALYGLLVLVPAGLRVGLRWIDLLVVPLHSSVTCVVTVALVGMSSVNGPVAVSTFASFAGGAGGMWFASVLLWGVKTDRVRKPLLSAILIGGTMMGAIPWLVDLDDPERPAILIALILWQTSTAFALGFVRPPSHDNPLLCTACEYNLRGNTTGQCPECGHPIPDAQQRRIQTATAASPPT